MDIKQNILDAVNEWLTPTFDKATQEAIIELMTTSPKELEESFYKNLEFGTGGMRGIMGVGNNRINKYTLGKSTQGLSDYMRTAFPNQPLKAVIAYDCRHNSDTLAKLVADVFSANGVEVYLFSDMRPTPELSFAVKYLGCQCGYSYWNHDDSSKMGNASGFYYNNIDRGIFVREISNGGARRKCNDKCFLSC